MTCLKRRQICSTKSKAGILELSSGRRTAANGPGTFKRNRPHHPPSPGKVEWLRHSRSAGGRPNPLESRILKLAVDFVEFQLGLILERKVSRDNAIELLKRYRERLYDPELTDRFIAMLLELAPDVEHADPPSWYSTPFA